ncbi:4-coumarate--CoA ligase 1-like [Melitaea cinxia]|uniref:4-coumarate--CoA ligase 1-like n=1 Tax=Melitaea cinxia TaxID=113334 RepID=UPI001E274529|nr:4-coumarate--CoA ligase 1-like [Melitaea cinxia]
MLRNKLYLYGDESVLLPAYLHAGKFMLNRFKTFDDNVAIIDAATDERMTFKEVVQLTVDVALSLTHIGIKKGDVVSICSQNVMEFLPVVYGTLAAGATFSPIDVTLGKASLLHRLNMVQPKILFFSPSAYNKHKDVVKALAYIDKIIIFGESSENTPSFKDFLIEHSSVEDFEAAPVNGSDDIALILFSSGTTGVSKGIKISHLNLLLHIQDKDYVSSLGVMSLGLFEWFTSYGLILTFYSHLKGFTVVFHNNADARKSFEIIEKYKINNIPSTPTTLVQLMKLTNSSHYDTSSMRAIGVTGTICHESTLDAIRKRFPSAELVMQLYGMTECGGICTPAHGRFGLRAGSVGGVKNNFVLKIVDVETRQPLGPNQRGEICYKSPALMKGYIGETIEYLDEEGFFKTGDIGYYDEDQYVYVVDRIKDLIKFNNYHIAPAEIESIILQHPAVREVGVVGAKNEEFHELPTAFVALQPGAQVTEKELVDFVDKQVSCKMRLAGGVRFLDALPRCAGVKVDRKKLRTML